MYSVVGIDTSEQATPSPLTHLPLCMLTFCVPPWPAVISSLNEDRDTLCGPRFARSEARVLEAEVPHAPAQGGARPHEKVPRFAIRDVIHTRAHPVSSDIDSSSYSVLYVHFQYCRHSGRFRPGHGCSKTHSRWLKRIGDRLLQEQLLFIAFEHIGVSGLSRRKATEKLRVILGQGLFINSLTDNTRYRGCDGRPSDGD